MNTLFEQYNVTEQQGSGITIPDNFPAIYVSENNEVYCYTGIYLNEKSPRDVIMHMNPYYMHGKHSTDKKFVSQIKGFFRITNGFIALDQFVDNQYHDMKYKKIDAQIRFPLAADTYFGVKKSWDDEDEALTRRIFGLTYSELSSVVESYAKVMGTYTNYVQYPRVTRSVRSRNHCDITDLLIPEQFPYITFNESGYDFSHVSLWGFYRYIQLLTSNSTSSPIGKILLQADVSETVLEVLLRIDDFPHYLTKVTKNTFNE